MDGTKICLLLKKMYFNDDNVTFKAQDNERGGILVTIETTIDYWLNATPSFRENLTRRGFSTLWRKAEMYIHGGKDNDERKAFVSKLEIKGLEEYLDSIYLNQFKKVLQSESNHSNLLKKAVEAFLGMTEGVIVTLVKRKGFTINILGIFNTLNTSGYDLKGNDHTGIKSLFNLAQDKLDNEILNLPIDITTNNKVVMTF
jgi:hypothetical protein